MDVDRNAGRVATAHLEAVETSKDEIQLVGARQDLRIVTSGELAYGRNVLQDITLELPGDVPRADGQSVQRLAITRRGVSVAAEFFEVSYPVLETLD